MGGFLTLLLLLFAFSAQAQLPVHHRVMSTPFTDIGTCSAPTRDGGYVQASNGVAFNNYGGPEVFGSVDIVATRFDAAGNSIYSKSLPLGFVNPANPNEIQILTEVPTSIVQTLDGGFLITATVNRLNNATPPGITAQLSVIVRLDNELNVVQVIQLNNGGLTAVKRALVDPTTGDVTVVGSVLLNIPNSNPPAASTSIMSVRFDATFTQFSGPFVYALANTGQIDELSFDATLTQDGNLAIAGTVVATAGNEDVFLLITDPDGAVITVQNFGAATIDRAYGIIEAPDGNLWICGASGSSATSLRGMLMQTDAAGRLITSRLLGPGGTANTLTLRSLMPDATGNIVAFGYENITSGTETDYNIFAASINPEFRTNWSNSYGGVGNERLSFDGLQVFGGYFSTASALGQDRFLWSGATSSFSGDFEMHSLLMDADGDAGCFSQAMNSTLRPLNMRATDLQTQQLMLTLQLGNPSIFRSEPFVYNTRDLCTDDPCNYIFTTEVRSPLCPNEDNGLILVSGTDANAATYTLFLDDEEIAVQDTGFFSGLSGGNYRIEVTYGDGCTETITRELANPDSIDLDADVTNASGPDEFDGAFTMNVNGGTAPYFYSIDGSDFSPNNAFTDLLPGVYLVVVQDANGCQETIEVEVGSGAGCTFAANVISVDNRCFGDMLGNIVFIPNGETAPYDVQLEGETVFVDSTSDGTILFENLPAGAYRLSATDTDGCTFDTLLFIMEPAEIVFGDPVLVQIPGCTVPNGSFNASVVSGGTEPFTYYLLNIDGDTLTTQTEVLFEGLAAGQYTVLVSDANGCGGFTEYNLRSESDLIADIQETNQPSCFDVADGSLVIAATGGTAPYEYQLNETVQDNGKFNNLGGGDYILTITDAGGCTFQTLISLINPAEIVGNVEVVNISCAGANDGQAIAFVEGGTGELLYSIDNEEFVADFIFSGLGAGIINVYVRDVNGCVQVFQDEITEPAAIVLVSVSSTPASCGGNEGTITVFATGGTGELQYSADGVDFFTESILTNLIAGTYIVIVRDESGCQVTRVVTVAQSGGLQVAIDEVISPSCPGDANGSVTINATSGGAPFEYSADGENFQRSGTFTGLAAGLYVFQARDTDGCLGFAEVTVVDPAPINIATRITAPGCGLSDGQIIATAAGGSFPYLYELISGTDTTRNDDGNFTGLAEGTYTIRVVDGQGCRNSAEAVLQNQTDYNITAAPTAVLCFGDSTGQLRVTVEGGGDFQYSINGTDFQPSNQFLNLPARRYTVTVRDASNCSDTVSAVINQGPAIVFDARPTDPTCGQTDGQIDIRTAGGTGTLNFSVVRAGQPTGNFTPNRNYTGLAGGNYDVYARDANGCETRNTVVLSSGQAVSITNVDLQDATCDQQNGVITITATGGASALRYSIDGGGNYRSNSVFAGLPGGTYQIVVNDGSSCEDRRTVTIINRADFTIDLTFTAPACQNPGTGSVSIAVTGGTEPYDYSLDGVNFQPLNTLSNLSTGPIEVFVRDASLCVDSQTGMVPGAGGITILPTLTNPTCDQVQNGRIVIEAMGGTSPYSYRLNGGNFQISNPAFNNLGAGTYRLSVRDDAGCEAEMSVDLTSAGTLTIVEIQAQAPGCSAEDGTITVVATTSASTLEYSINGGDFSSENMFSGLSQATYLITVRDDAGCSGQVSYSLEGVADFDVDFDITNVACNNPFSGRVVVNAVGDNTPFTYSTDGVVFITNNVYSDLSAGTYTFFVRDNSGCEAPFSVTIAPFAGITASARVVNNPGCNFNDPFGVVQLTAMGGAGAYEYSRDGANYQSDRSFTGLTAGSYVFFVRDINGCQASTNPQINLENGTPVQLTSIIVQVPTCGATNGSITFNVENPGGNLSYTYSIGNDFVSTNNFANLRSGTYNATIRNGAGCQIDTTLNLISTGTFTVSANVNSPACFGGSDGSIELTATGGGGGPFLYRSESTQYGANAIFEDLSIGTYAFDVIQVTTNCVVSRQITMNGPAAIVINTTFRNATCPGRADGGLTLAATGGTGAYTYSLDGSAFSATLIYNNLIGGMHEVSVRDANGCTQTEMVNLPSGPGVNVPEIFVVQPRCNGINNGRARITATGGERPYQYSLDGTAYQASSIFRDLPPGQYAAYVRDNRGCEVQDPQAFTLVPEIEDFISAVQVTQASCDTSARARLTVLTKETGAQYALNDGPYGNNNSFANLAPGTYTVSARLPSGCFSTREVVIDTPATVTLTAVTPMAPRCNGDGSGSIMIEASSEGNLMLMYSIDGENYQASPMFEDVHAGQYLARVRNSAGCEVSATTTIVAPNELSIDQVRVRRPACANGADGAFNVRASGGTGMLMYALTYGNGSFQAEASFAGLLPGMYMVIVRDSNGCLAIAEANIENVDAFGITLLRQNATNFAGDNGRIDVRVTAGEGPFAYALNSGEFGTANFFENLMAGSYTVTVRDGKGCTATRTVVIQLDPRTICEAPRRLEVVRTSGTTAQLTWMAVNASAGYTLRYRVSNTDNWMEMEAVSNSLTVMNLMPETMYDFQVRTNCTADNSSIWSSPAMGTTGVACGTTLRVETNSTSSSITLTWDSVDEANRYQVTYRQAGTGWTTATLPTNATTYTLTNLEPGTEYSIRIRSLCSDQLSAWTRTYMASTMSQREESALVAGERTVVTLSVYPNPNSGQFNVAMRAETARTAQMIMMDLSGRVILNVNYDLTAGENNIPVVLDGVASGLYTLRVITEGADIYKKIVVN